MSHILQPTPFVVNFSNDTYAQIDKAQGTVTIHQGQRVGLDTDWGGQVIAFLTLDQAQAIAEVLWVPWSQPSEAYQDVQPEQYRGEYIGD